MPQEVLLRRDVIRPAALPSGIGERGAFEVAASWCHVHLCDCLPGPKEPGALLGKLELAFPQSDPEGSTSPVVRAERHGAGAHGSSTVNVATLSL